MPATDEKQTPYSPGFSAKPGARPPGRELWRSAALVAAITVGILLVQHVVTTGASGATAATQLPSSFVGGIIGAIALQFLLVSVPFGIGVLLSLRFVLPVRGADGLLRVVASTLVAACAGGVIVFVVALVRLLFGFSSYGFVEAPRSFFGDSFPGYAIDVVGALRALWDSVLTGLGEVVGSAPVVILAGIVVWIWLARGTPWTGWPRHAPTDTPVV